MNPVLPDGHHQLHPGAVDLSDSDAYLKTLAMYHYQNALLAQLWNNSVPGRGQAPQLLELRRADPSALPAALMGMQAFQGQT